MTHNPPVDPESFATPLLVHVGQPRPATGLGLRRQHVEDLADLRRADRLGLTVLAEHHRDVCRQLAGPVDRRFDDVPVTITDDGAVLLDEGLARFDCWVYREVEAGDHTIVLLLLHAVDHTAGHGVGAPLVFHRSAFGRMAV